MSNLLTLTEAVKRSGISRRTIERYIAEDKLPVTLVGARKRVHPADLDRLFSASSSRPAVGPCRVIAVANQKGGVGKTSTCANLAATLSSGGCRVLAVDCDAQGNLTSSLGSDPDQLEITLYNVLIDRTPIDQAILTPVLQCPTLSLIGSTLDLAAADHQLGGMVAREMRLRQVLEPILSRYDFIFIDCPPALGLLTLNALTAATEIIVPVEMGMFSLRGVARLIDTIAEVRTVNSGLGKVRALANRVDNTVLSTQVHEELERAFREDLFKTTIRKSVKIGEAQVRREPITVYKPRDPAARDYVKLAEEVLSYGV